MKKENDVFHLLAIVASLFLIVSIVFVGVITANQLKERKYIGINTEKERVVSVAGQGEVFAKPDTAIVTFSVINEAETAEEAMRENSRKMNAVTNFFKEEGIEEKDLKTTNLVVYPHYEYRSLEEFFPPTGERVLVSYQANQSLEVKIRDLDKAGLMIEGATKAGANQVNNLVFQIEDEEELKNEARLIAVRSAQEKAKEIGTQLGVKLERVISYSEDSQLPYFPRSMDMAEGLGSAEDFEIPQIEAGENKIEVRVVIGYEINY